MLNSIPSLNRSLDHYSRAAGSLLRSADALGAAADPIIRPVVAVDPDSGVTPAGPQQTPPAEPLETAAANLISAKNGVRGAVALVRAEDSMIGSLLDVLA